MKKISQIRILCFNLFKLRLSFKCETESRYIRTDGITKIRQLISNSFFTVTRTQKHTACAYDCAHYVQILAIQFQNREKNN